MSFAIELCLKTALLLICAALAARMLARFSAAARHGLRAAALSAVLAFPAIAMVVPAVNLEILPERLADWRPPFAAADPSPAAVVAGPAPAAELSLSGSAAVRSRWIEDRGYPVLSVRLILDAVSRTSPSFAHVQLTASARLEEAERILNGEILQGRRIYVRRVVRWTHL